MKLQRLLSLLRQAIDQYQMIEHGDHIAIGISGGKDSLTLLYGLSQLQKFYPKHFNAKRRPKPESSGTWLQQDCLRTP